MKTNCALKHFEYLEMTMGSEGLEPTTPAVFLPKIISSCQSGVLTKLDDEPEEEMKSVSETSFKCFPRFRFFRGLPMKLGSSLISFSRDLMKRRAQGRQQILRSEALDPRSYF